MITDVGFTLVGGENPLLFVPVSVNRRAPRPFMLDTGAGLCMLTREFAARLGVERLEEKKGLGAGGAVTVHLGRVQSFALGEAQVADLQVAITGDLHEICSAVARADGIVGYNYLKNFRLTLDYQAASLRLQQGGEPAGPSALDAREVAFRLAHPAKPLILLPARVNGSGPYPFVLDTGATASVVSASLAKELGIRGADASPVYGAGGSAPALQSELRSLEIGAARSENLSAAVVDFLNPLGQAVGKELHGIVGYNFLRQFRVTIDYPRGVVRFDPASAADRAPLCQDHATCCPTASVDCA